MNLAVPITLHLNSYLSESHGAIFSAHVTLSINNSFLQNSFILHSAIFVLTIVSIYIIMRLLYHRQNLKYSWKLEKLEKEKLNEISEAKMRFFTDLSHDLRTPITLISNSIESLTISNKSFKNDESLLLTVIHRNSERIRGLIEEILEFGKLDHSKQKLNIEKLSLIDFLESALEHYAPIETEKQLQIKKKYSSQIIDTYMDAQKLDQLLHNLISNSFKYTPINGKIIISASSEEDCQNNISSTIITIFNESDYISKEKLSKLFDRFYQVDEKQKGIGLGLTIAKSIVELHNGKITANYIYEKQGIEFKISIPQAISKNTNSEVKNSDLNISYPKKEQENNGITAVPESNYSVLLIEDNKELCDMVTRELSPFFNISSANNGEVGIELAEKNVPDIILCDVVMPKMSGFEVVQKIKNNINTCHIPVIMLTAKSSDADKIEGYNSGADAYIIKPFNLDVLKVQIERTLQNRTIVKKNYDQWSNSEGKTKMPYDDHSFMGMINKHLEANITNGDFGVNELSEIINLSTAQLYRKIKTLSGVTPVEYIRGYKLKKAKKLLSHYEYSIKQIAYMSGFKDQSYFGKCFKNEFGIPPQLYRAKYVEFKVEDQS